ncbi:MAG: rubredoxin-like domain-containing protein [Bacillota bacterium]
MQLWKCSVCNFIFEGEDAPDKCPKCGAPKEKFNQVNEEVTTKIQNARETNDLLMASVGLLEELEVIGESGAEINLDPLCLKFFTALKDESKLLRQIALAEIENHVKKEKWG